MRKRMRKKGKMHVLFGETQRSSCAGGATGGLAMAAVIICYLLWNSIRWQIAFSERTSVDLKA